MGRMFSMVSGPPCWSGMTWSASSAPVSPQMWQIPWCLAMTSRARRCCSHPLIVFVRRVLPSQGFFSWVGHGCRLGHCGLEQALDARAMLFLSVKFPAAGVDGCRLRV